MRFPEFTGEWNRYKVSDVLDFYSTNSLSWDQLEYNTDELQNLHYGLIHVGLPTAVDLNEDVLPNIKKEFLPKNYELCKNGDVAFADASEDTNEVAKAIEFVNLSNRNVVCGLHTIHGRDNHDLTTVGFKGYAFASESFHNQIRRIAQGTKIFSISSKNFAECYIGIPSKEEQAKIARLLKLIDERISTQIRIINEIQSLISGITQKISKQSSIRMTMLSELLEERNEKNAALFPVHSVSVSEGVVNQIDYLGRSFAAADTSHYNVAHKGDIIYTKSPTGEFPFGIVKRNAIESNVAVSPLYGVYKPVTDEVAIYLHYYFCSPLNAQNYLHKLIQKGAKNTINITNQRFIQNCIPLPDKTTLEGFVKLTTTVSTKLKLEKSLLEKLQKQKRYLLTQMFV